MRTLWPSLKQDRQALRVAGAGRFEVTRLPGHVAEQVQPDRDAVLVVKLPQHRERLLEQSLRADAEISARSSATMPRFPSERAMALRLPSSRPDRKALLVQPPGRLEVFPVAPPACPGY